MQYPEIAAFINAVIDKVEELIPEYMQRKEDREKERGGVAVCILDPEGRVYGKMFGEDRIMARERYRVAWTKASQAWITGLPTGEYERRVFNKEIDEGQFGIRRPDLIGWEGGQPLHLPDGTMIAAGFGGFTSASDLEIVQRALAMVQWPYGK
jgi:glc operon protein GlcG